MGTDEIQARDAAGSDQRPSRCQLLARPHLQALEAGKPFEVYSRSTLKRVK
jgi:hypothetical protein